MESSPAAEPAVDVEIGAGGRENLDHTKVALSGGNSQRRLPASIERILLRSTQQHGGHDIDMSTQGGQVESGLNRQH